MMQRSTARSVKRSPTTGGSTARDRAASADPERVRKTPRYAVGPGVQAKVAIGRPNDAYEVEANAVAAQVAAGGAVAPTTISSVAPGTLTQPATEREKKPEPKPASGAEKKSPVRSAPAAASDRKPEAPPRETEKKPEPTPAPREPEKKPEPKSSPAAASETKPIQKAPQVVVPEGVPLKDGKKPAEEQAPAGGAAEAREPAEKRPEKAIEPKTPQRPPFQLKATEEREEHPARRAAARGEGAAEEECPTEHEVETAERAIARKGPGRPLDPETQKTLESRMGVDLSGVRVHSDPTAQDAAVGLGARAFTHGTDIWLGPGESDADMGLMAHEAAHVVQQADGVQRQLLQRWATGRAADLVAPAAASAVVQRANGGGSPPAPAAAPGGGAVGTATTPTGPGSPAAAATVDPHSTPKRIVIPLLTLPAFKVTRHSDRYGGELVLPTTERDTDQMTKWKTAVRPGVNAKVEAMLTDANAQYVESPTSGRDMYFLKSLTSDFYLFGSKASIKSEALIPYWDRAGKERLLAVDHRQEIQLGGVDEPANYELLDASANSSSGSAIRNEVVARISAAVGPHSNGQIWPSRPTVAQLRQEGWDIRFQRAQTGLPVTGAPGEYWSLAEVQRGDHLDKLKVLTAAEIEQAGLRGSATELVIYTAARGGTPRRVPWPQGAGTTQPVTIRDFYPGFDLKQVVFTPTQAEGSVIGSITGDVFARNEAISKGSVNWELRKARGIVYGGYINDLGIMATIRDLQLRRLSPITFTEARLDSARGLFAVGQVAPSVPLLGNAGIDLVIEGNNVRLRKLFTTSDLALPRPIQLTESNLEVSIGTDGLGVRGEVRFKIERVGEGRVAAGARTGLAAGEAGFEIEGEFNFDSRLFDPARVRMWYRDNALGGEGTLGIKAGKVRGIRSATITASYAEQRLQASGSAELDIPGIQRGTMTLSYSESEGFAIGGSFQLANDVPGIRSGSVEAQVRQRSGAEAYEVTARGTAVPKIPGISATIGVSYENGIFTVEGTAGYSRGMLSGTVTVGVTNRPVDDQGRPGGEPTNRLRAYGGGTVTVRIAPWLQGTIGLRLLPNGEMEVSGTIGLPSALNIFPEKRLDKNIFSINIDIPIVGVSVAGQNVGIFATIGGGLDLSAGIGPGQLADLRLGITYNPAHEEQTHVTGGARLQIPAHAGLRLSVRGGIGVGIPIVSARAGLEIGGQLGLEGAVSAGVQVDWTPARGLVLDALGEIYVEPKLKFDVSGYVTVDADFLIGKIELYSKRWQLAAFEYGSGLRFGVRFPIHYEEGKAFDVSLSDVQFQVPDIRPRELLAGLLERL